MLVGGGRDWVASPLAIFLGTIKNGRGMKSKIDKTCLTYWFPRIQGAGLPVPKTIMVDAGDVCLPKLAYGMRPKGMSAFLRTLQVATDAIGYPCFLRTGLTSAKHSWDRSCHLTDPAKLLGHVAEIVEFSECCQLVGLSTRWWVVREMLPVRPVCVLTGYRGMPLVREFRFFTKAGHWCCQHPYWPEKAVGSGRPDNKEWKFLLAKQHKMDAKTLAVLGDYADRAALACPGDDWSIDFIETDRGWVLTDMAEAGRSFHWLGCDKA